MQIELDQFTPGEVYALMTQIIIPRPIAWVLSRNRQGQDNLAPFSYFNAISSDPPMLMVSISKQVDGRDKDTLANIEENPYLVVHIAHTEQLDKLNQSSATLEPDCSEVDLLSLKCVDFAKFPLPRLEDCRVALGCQVDQIMRFAKGKKQALVLAEVKTLWIDSNVSLKDDRNRMKIDALSLNPLARLGAGEYAQLGSVVARKRPQ